MLNRIIGVMKFDLATYNEIEKDPAATWQAFIVVVVSSLLAAFAGGFGKTSIQGFGEVFFGVGIGVNVATHYKIAAIAGWAVIAWLLWSVLTQIIGTKVFKGEATIAKMMRVIGYAYAPLAIQVFMFLPLVGIMFIFGAAVWSIAAVFVAIREGLELSSGNAFWTAAIGGVLYLVGMGILLAIL